MLMRLDSLLRYEQVCRSGNRLICIVKFMILLYCNLMRSTE